MMIYSSINARTVLEHAADYLAENGGCEMAARLVELFSDAAMYEENGNAPLAETVRRQALSELFRPEEKLERAKQYLRSTVRHDDAARDAIAILALAQVDARRARWNY